MASRPTPAQSSRALTRESGTFTRVTPINRSLQRGLQLLRAFNHGAELLGNGELAVRAGLPLSTVSRLTSTLVQERFLDYDIQRQSYRLAPVILSLADTFSRNDHTSEAAFPKMKSLAEKERINVGLSVADHLEMVYVVSLRESKRGIFRRAVPGSRFPIELTAGGRAFMSGLDEPNRRAVLQQLGHKHGRAWKALRTEIEAAFADVAQHGHCVAYWAPGMTAIGTPIAAPDGRSYALSITYHSMDVPKSQEAYYGSLLLALREEILGTWDQAARLAVP
ncbi:IclR family transcriptional regulator [Pseudorhodoferax sp. Leaf274]|uniref:IclR family transcriptional regulator n=1 Tax=Pseudorhodoferax sp. Leaf274 TaxID=1736318 RepID=UPI000702B3FA|nr:IclR family transcriptional regulator [Pseudorhodoferax sp. Leaf274]KQP37084.1 hypothetical protein ASF44_15320 [Pseudorhodoferax sp. Leaf274]